MMADVANSPTGGNAKPPAPTLTRWNVALLAVALLILAGFSAWVVDHYQPDTATNAATILGIVVPAFATIGAAAFGINVAYKAGQAQGDAQGQQKGQAEGKAAVNGARQEAVEILRPRLAAAQTALEQHVNEMQMKSFSPPGQRQLLFGLRTVDVDQESAEGIRLLPEPVEVDRDPIDKARMSIASAIGAMEAIGGAAASGDVEG